MKKEEPLQNQINMDEQIQLLRAAVQDTEDSVLITDADVDYPGPRIVFVNPGFRR